MVSVSAIMGADAKMKELILYICKKSEKDKKFGSTKLNKELFYADFTAYRKYGKAITGVRYQKITNGPAPRCIPPLTQEMKAGGELDIVKRDYAGYTQHVPMALRAPKNIFSEQEKEVIDATIEALKTFNGSDCSNCSHGLFWWDLFTNGEDLDYSLALVGLPDNVTEEEQRYAFSLEERAKAWIQTGIR
jgi:hypothetical protein